MAKDQIRVNQFYYCIVNSWENSWIICFIIAYEEILKCFKVKP